MAAAKNQTTMFVEEVTDGGHSVDSSYGDSLEAAELADVIGATLVRTMCVATCGGFVVGWLPGVLLLGVLEFNLSFFPTTAARFEWWASPAAQTLQIAALVSLLVWRFGDASSLSRARAQLMCVDKPSKSDDAREAEVKEVMAILGWSYFVQGGLGCWMLIPVLTLGRIAALITVGAMWFVLDSWDLAPFGVEVALARLLPDADTREASAVDGAHNARGPHDETKKRS